jgi:predicted transcriptional regulator
MASKKEVEEMLKQSIESGNKNSTHIEALWTEIGEKQSKIYDLNWEISELKSENTDLSTKIKECMEKRHSIKRAQYQKDWLEHFNPMKTDN